MPEQTLNATIREWASGTILPSQEWQFRHLVERLPVGAYACDCDGLITFFNRQAVQLWGRVPKLNDSIDRFCGSFKLFAPDGSPISHDECWMALALKDDQEYQAQEIVIERPDGRRIPVLAYASPVRNEDGKLIGGLNVLVDMTDRKRADELQALLASVVESSDDAIVSKSLDGKIRSWNSGAERIFGYTASEAIGQPITIIIPLERRDEELLILSRLSRGERIEHYETVRVTKDGRPLDISLTISPVFDSTGHIVGASKIARDITARKRAEAALVVVKDELENQLFDLKRLHEMSLRLSKLTTLEPILEEALRTAVAIEGADSGILWICTSDTKQLTVGASFGIDSRRLESLSPIPPAGVASMKCFQQEQRIVVEDIESDSLFDSYRIAARKVGVRAVHCTPLITRGGQIVGVLSTYCKKPRRPSERDVRLVDLCARQAVDFIENALLYSQLRDADRAKNTFLATLAHELRNPLAPIRNAVQFLQMKGPCEPDLQNARDIIDRQLTQMVVLVDDLLDIARITQDKLKLRMERVALASVIHSAVETSRPIIDGRGHELAVKLPTEPIYLDGDPARLSQVISNLLNNAAKYTERGGCIWLTVEQDGEEAVVSVRDNGIGIPKEMLPRVLEMFMQVERPADDSQAGMGIGLTLVKRLVEMHGGTVEVHSEGRNQGTKVTVRLPRTSEPAPSQPATMGNEAVKQAPPLRIMVVDDNRDSATSLSMLLKIMGNVLRTAYDGLEAVALAKEFQPDVVVLDIGLPKLDGYEAARRIRQDANAKGMTLIALTGWGQDEDKQRTADAGFDHHLVKPVDFDALKNLLSSLKSRGDGLRVA